MAESDDLHSSGVVIDRAIAATLVTAIIFCPLAMGTVQRWSEAVFITLACAAAVLSAVRIVAGRFALRCSGLTAIPLIAFPVLIAVQLLPWPWLVSMISPAAMRIRSEQLADLMSQDLFTRRATVTLYAEETARHARLLCGVIAIFCATRVVARRRTFAHFLLYGMCAAGAIVGAIALAHQAASAEKIFGFIAVPRNITRAAPFMHHSHFAQFMNLSIGAALALTFVKLAEVIKERKPKVPSEWIDLAQQGELNGLILPMVTLLVSAVGLATSGSRGGAAAAAIAGALTFCLALANRRSRGPALIGIGLIVLSAGAALAVSSTLRDRLAHLRDGDISSGDRWTLLVNQFPIWKSFPLLGTGLGTFEWIFPRYDTTRPINIASHAENEYAQMITETGVIGFGLIIMFLVGTWAAYFRVLRHGGRRSLLGLGLGFGLAAICVQSALDFGQHLPANAAMLAMTISCLISASFWNDESDPGAPPMRRSRLPRVVFPILAIVLCGFVWQSIGAARAEALANGANRIAARLAAQGWRGDDQTYAALRQKFDAACALGPNDAQHQYQSAMAHYYSLVRDHANGLPPSADLAEVGEILDQFDLAMALCPTYGAPYSMAGQISFAMRDTLRGRMLLDRAVQLSPHDGVSAFIAAQAAAQRGDGQRAVQLMQRARSTSAVGDGEILDALLEQFDRADLAVQYAAGDYHALFSLEERLGKRPPSPQTSAHQQAAFNALRELADRPRAEPELLARLASALRARGEPGAALPLLRRATVQRPTELAWRFSLATLANDLGDRDLARSELAVVRRDRPDWPGSAELARKLGVD
jgi:O-antigen ligase/tetratricopeptide (TPR) repeat protein